MPGLSLNQVHWRFFKSPCPLFYFENTLYWSKPKPLQKPNCAIFSINSGIFRKFLPVSVIYFIVFTFSSDSYKKLGLKIANLATKIILQLVFDVKINFWCCLSEKKYVLFSIITALLIFIFRMNSVKNI